MVLSSWKDTIFSAHVQDSKASHFGIATQTSMQTQRKWRCVKALGNIWQGAGLHTDTTQGNYLQALPNISIEDKCWRIYAAQGHYLQALPSLLVLF
jgi:hypothetical protein